MSLGWYWAQQGITVVPTLSWAQSSSYRFCFKGIPKHSTVATSTVGVARDKTLVRMARRDARATAPGAVPRAALRKISIRFRRLRGREYKAVVSMGGRGKLHERVAASRHEFDEFMGCERRPSPLSGYMDDKIRLPTATQRQSSVARRKPLKACRIREETRGGKG
ncbi:MAG: DUF4417 domain-containing protein [Collinsella sp.]